jgi:hypothetical protein
MSYGEIQFQRQEASRLIGEYYRAVSLFLNGGYFPRPDTFALDLESKHGRYLLARANKQYSGCLEKTKDGNIKIRCEYCGKVYRINEIDQHQRECPLHD